MSWVLHGHSKLHVLPSPLRIPPSSTPRDYKDDLLTAEIYSCWKFTSFSLLLISGFFLCHWVSLRVCLNWNGLPSPFSKCSSPGSNLKVPPWSIGLAVSALKHFLKEESGLASGLFLIVPSSFLSLRDLSQAAGWKRAEGTAWCQADIQ